MKRLTLVFDPRCPPCRRWARWVAGQPAFLKIALLSARDPRLPAHCASLAAPDEAHAPLTVLGERGEIWRGEHAMRLGLWALREHRRASFDPRSTALALAEHDAALCEHRVRPVTPATWARPAPIAGQGLPEPRGSWCRDILAGLISGVMGLVLLPVLLLVGVAACGLGYDQAGPVGALGMLLLLAFLLAKGLACAGRQT